MPPFSPNDGVDETEPTLISDGAVQDCAGSEYRVGQTGLYCARGRGLYGDIGAVDGVGLYEAGFDDSPGFVLAQAGDTLYSAPISVALTFTQADTFAVGSSAMVGTHYANRHYLASSVANRRIEATVTGGVTSYPIGLSASTLGITANVSVLGGSVSATTGLVYWVTEYDSVRGLESITGSSCNTGPFTNRMWAQAVVSGVTVNPTADTLRWYRSLDGGGFPDGGLIGETPIGTTFFNDGGLDITQLPAAVFLPMAPTSVLTTPLYGLVTIGGIDVERDTAPPVLSTIFGPFDDSLIGVSPEEPRNLRFSAAGYPDSWPTLYGLPLDTHRRDEIVTGVVLPGRIGVFCVDSVHAIYRLPRDSDSIFAAGEMSRIVTDVRGCVSRRGATVFTPNGSDGLAAFVSRDGIWLTDLSSSPVPVTDKVDWEGRVSTMDLRTCRLTDDPRNRRLVFLYRRATDTLYNTGIWYLDYQEFTNRGVRICFADHGPLADAQTVAGPDGKRTLVSIDSRQGNGQVYQESVQDADDSHLVDSAGSVSFMMRTKEFMPAGPQDAEDLGMATWMHDAGPPRIEHRFYFDRRDDNPEFKLMERTEERNASDIMLNRSVNSFSLQLSSVGTRSYGIHWIEVEGLGSESLGGREGA
jgi:hypothetical protein